MTSRTTRLRGMHGHSRPVAKLNFIQLSHLRWMATVLPAVAVFLYESLRHQFFDQHTHVLDLYGNLLTAGVALGVSYIFAGLIFQHVEHIQKQAVEKTRTAAALSSMIEERERLSRELHDGLAQVLSYLLVRLDTVRNLVEENRSEHAVAELEALRAAVDDVNIEVRDSIAGLRNRVVERGLPQALSDYLDEYEERYGIKAQVRISDPRVVVSPFAALQLFRVVQEALTNVRKHAGANAVEVSVDSDEDELTVLISDDGVGFDQEQAGAVRGRFGMVGMKERIASLGGSCSVESSAGRGTTVRILVPANGLQ